MTKDGRLSKRDMQALDRAWEVLSRWTEAVEGDKTLDDYDYDMAMTACTGLCEFINNYVG